MLISCIPHGNSPYSSSSSSSPPPFPPTTKLYLLFICCHLLPNTAMLPSCLDIERIYNLANKAQISINCCLHLFVQTHNQGGCWTCYIWLHYISVHTQADFRTSMIGGLLKVVKVWNFCSLSIGTFNRAWWLIHHTLIRYSILINRAIVHPRRITTLSHPRITKFNKLCL